MSILLLLLSLFRLLRLTSAPPAADPPSDPPSRTSEVLARYGPDAVRMAEKVSELETDLYKIRRKRDELQTEVERLKSKQVPDGAVVLTGDDAAAWEAYTKLGKPSDVQSQLEAGQAATAERDTLKRSMTVRQVAELVKFKPGVLEQLDKARGGLEYVVKDGHETQGGKQVPVKRVYVKDGDKETLLTDFAKSEWSDFLPSLQVAEPAPAPPGNHTRQTPRSTQETTVPVAPVRF